MMHQLTLQQAFALAQQLHEAGDLSRAAFLYERILELQPQQPDVLYLLGMLWFQRDECAKSAQYLASAVQNSPTNPRFQHDYAVVLQRLGHANEAISAYEQAVSIAPHEHNYLSHLASAYQATGDRSQAHAIWRELCRQVPSRAEAWFQVAETCDASQPQLAIQAYQEAIRLQPDFLAAHNNLAILLQKQAAYPACITAYRKALELQPNLVATRYNLAVAYQANGDRNAAIQELRIILQQHPRHLQAATHMATLLVDLDQLEAAQPALKLARELSPDNVWLDLAQGSWHQKQAQYEEAQASYLAALEKQPRLADAHFAQVNLLIQQSLYREAAVLARNAIRQGIEYAPLVNALAVVLFQLERYDEALQAQQVAVQMKPQHVEYQVNLGQLYSHYERYDEALACFEKAMVLDPAALSVQLEWIHLRQTMCDWTGLLQATREFLQQWSARSESALAGIRSPFAFLTLPVEASPICQKRCAEQRVREQLIASGPLDPLPSADQSPRATTKLRIGYLSADFHEHATSYLLTELLESHDREHFEVIGYSYGPVDESPLRQRIVQAVDRFNDVRLLTDQEIAKKIQDDSIDILVDLKGHTRWSRMNILACRPAPIQLHYLGYPGTTGANYIDYFIADEYVIPLEQRASFTEQVVYLPGCYQVNDSQRKVAEKIPTRRECGLPETGFVFCSFNNNYKITEVMFGTWMRMLQRVPGSVLWLLAGNVFAAENLRKSAGNYGLDAQRLIFAPFKSTAEHMARYHCADLFLDTYPVNAHTTASDALWMACPVLTMSGETFVSRVAGSLLQALSLPELIVSSLAEYERKGVELALNPNAFATLQQRLHQNRKHCSLFNASGFAKNIEAAYQHMWKRHCGGKSPQSFTITAELVVRDEA